MSSNSDNSFKFDTAGTYAVVVHAMAAYSDQRISLGRSKNCRYCGTQDPGKFRKRAHTIPEALGNKWVFSLDECDLCNDKFSIYEDSLIKAVSPFLLFGGTKGKNTISRQIGKSNAPLNIRHERIDGKRRISVQDLSAIDGKADLNFDGQVREFMSSGELEINVPSNPFVPRYAYKALVKMAIALLPEDELIHFGKLIAWVKNVDDQAEFHILDVNISVGSIGNAPELVAGYILKRSDVLEKVPYMLMVLYVGTLCFTIDLMPDELDDHLPPMGMGVPKIGHDLYIGPHEDEDRVHINYDLTTYFNWASPEKHSRLVDKFYMKVIPPGNSGVLTPVYSPALAPFGSNLTP